MEEVPTGAKVETVKDSTELVTGATVTAVTEVFMLMPMIPFRIAQASRTKTNSQRSPQPPGEATLHLSKIVTLSIS